MGTIKVDASQKPAHLDLPPAEKDRTMKTIFLLDGDTLKIAGATKDGARPKSFDDADVKITLKRKKK